MPMATCWDTCDKSASHADTVLCCMTRIGTRSLRTCILVVHTFISFASGSVHLTRCERSCLPTTVTLQPVELQAGAADDVVLQPLLASEPQSQLQPQPQPQLQQQLTPTSLDGRRIARESSSERLREQRAHTTRASTQQQQQQQQQLDTSEVHSHLTCFFLAAHVSGTWS